MSLLHALVYVSTAARPLADAELTPLVERWRVRNAEVRVSGMLLMAHGGFMHYLEGPEASIAWIYEAIGADRRHFGLIELLHEPIKGREFPDWPLAFLATPRRHHADAAAHAAEVALRAADGPRSAGHLLLSTFWASNQST